LVVALVAVALAAAVLVVAGNLQSIYLTRIF
jgi:Flp pilus assembly pilin Flp